MEDEVGGEVRVDLRFILAGQLQFADANQTGNEFFSTRVAETWLSQYSVRACDLDPSDVAAGTKAAP